MKSKIFGEEHFFDDKMVRIIEDQRNQLIDDRIFNSLKNEINFGISISLPKIVVDRDRLEKWVRLCLQLENIDKADLMDMATQKKFADLHDELKKLKLDYLAVNTDYNWCREELALKDHIIAEKEQEIIVLKKALRLALSEGYYDAIEYFVSNKPTQDEYVETNMQRFINQAREEIKTSYEQVNGKLNEKIEKGESK